MYLLDTMKLGLMHGDLNLLATCIVNLKDLLGRLIEKWQLWHYWAHEIVSLREILIALKWLAILLPLNLRLSSLLHLF